MLSGGYKSVMQARNRDEFRDEIVRFARGRRRLGGAAES